MPPSGLRSSYGGAKVRPLEGTAGIAVDGMASRPLCRLLETLGATIRDVPVDAEHIAHADFLVDALGLERLADRGITRARLEAWNPALVRVSVTPVGRGGEPARWRRGAPVAWGK